VLDESFPSEGGGPRTKLEAKIEGKVRGKMEDSQLAYDPSGGNTRQELSFTGKKVDSIREGT